MLNLNWSAGPKHIVFFQRSWAFHQCPCPPTRDLDSRVTGLVSSKNLLKSVFHAEFELDFDWSWQDYEVEPRGNEDDWTRRIITRLFVCLFFFFLVACLFRPSAWRLVDHIILFLCFFFILWPYCFCPNAVVTSNTAPANPHAIGVAVYPALCLSVRPYGLFIRVILWARRLLSVKNDLPCYERLLEKHSVVKLWRKNGKKWTTWQIKETPFFYKENYTTSCQSLSLKYE